MSHTTTKAKLVFLPLLFLGIIFILVYSLLYWLFYIQLDIIPLKADIVQYWIPAGLSIVSVLLVIRPRVHLLRLDKDNGRIRTLYYMVGAAAFCIPTIITLNYLDSATGRLTALNSITEISQKPATKYYTVNSYVLYKDKIGIESMISYSGKHNQYLDMDIYIAMPFTADLSDTLRPPSAYLSIKYHKQISSKISDAERKEQWSNFWTASFDKFYNDRIHFVYLEKPGNTSDRDNMIIAAEKSDLYQTGSSVVLLKPVDQPFEKKNGHKLGYIFLSLGIGFFVWLIMIVIPGLHESKAEKFVSGDKAQLRQQFIEAYDLVKPRNGFIATPLLIALNTLVFIIMVFRGLGFMQFYTRDLIPWGAIYEPAIERGEWWRLISAIFLHGGFFHLFMNMVSLYLAGVFLELFINTKRFVIAYLVSGIAAGLISMWWHEKPVVAVGASGAIFGLYGILLALISFKIFDATLNKFLLILLVCTAGYSLIMGFLSEGIDNSAHLGGLSAGFLLGCFFAMKIKSKRADDSPL